MPAENHPEPPSRGDTPAGGGRWPPPPPYAAPRAGRRGHPRGYDPIEDSAAPTPEPDDAVEEDSGAVGPRRWWHSLSRTPFSPTALRVGVVVCGLAVLAAGVALLWARAGTTADPTALAETSPPQPTAPGQTPGQTPGQAEESPGTVVVHVGGEVADPGLVELPAGARVADAIEAAGGPTGDLAADALNQVNMARHVLDGEQILLGVEGAARGGAAGSGEDTPVDLNLATAEELQELPGIGPVLAESIVEYRDAHGGFTSVDELAEVRGIGEQRLADLRERVVVPGS